jgi:ParB-like chromosome segregation protein Spo0J
LNGQVHTNNLEITLFDIDKLVSDPENTRSHDNRNKEAVKRSIERFGLRKPIVAAKDTNVVYAGNLTLEVAIELGFTQIPVAWIPAETPEKICQAYAIADNKTSELGDWDNTQLQTVIKELDALPDFDLRDTGFELKELDELFPDLIEQKEETFDVAEAMEDESEPITQTGDIWLCGQWVYCPKCGRKHDL